jgi:hypothetical protein
VYYCILSIGYELTSIPVVDTEQPFHWAWLQTWCHVELLDQSSGSRRPVDQGFPWQIGYNCGSVISWVGLIFKVHASTYFECFSGEDSSKSKKEKSPPTGANTREWNTTLTVTPLVLPQTKPVLGYTSSCQTLEGWNRMNSALSSASCWKPVV